MGERGLSANAAPHTAELLWWHNCLQIQGETRRPRVFFDSAGQCLGCRSTDTGALRGLMTRDQMAACSRFSGLFLIWLALMTWSPASWAVGVLAALAATWWSLRLLPPAAA